MKIFFFLIFLNLFSFEAIAQASKKDSLIQQLQLHSKEDTLRYNILNELGLNYKADDPEASVAYFLQAIDLGERLGLKLPLAKSYKSLSFSYYAMGLDSLYIAKARKSISLFEKYGGNKEVGNGYFNLSLRYYDLGNYDSAINNQVKALSIFESIKDTIGVYYSHNSLGVSFFTLSNFDLALDHYLKASYLVKPDDSLMRSSINSNIALVYKNTGDYANSLEYNQRALSFSNPNGKTISVANIYSNMGNLYDTMHEFDSALVNYEKSLSIYQSLENEVKIAGNFINIGITFFEMKRFDESFKMLNSAEEQLTDYSEFASLSLLYLMKARLFMEGSEDFVSRHESFQNSARSETLDFLINAESFAVQSQNLVKQKEAKLYLSKFYQRNREFENSLSAYQEFVVLSDSILNDEKMEEISRLKFQYDYEKKEALLKADFENKQTEAALVAQTERNKKYIAYSVFFGIVLFSGFGYVMERRIRSSKEKVKLEKLNSLINETELKALRAQMNPHFIFNSLNSINHFIVEGNLDQAEHFLLTFSQLMREILENSEREKVLLSEDLEVLRKYMDLEKMRLKDRFSYIIDVDPQLDAGNVLIPSMILQPFIENSIWHGFSSNITDGEIRINIRSVEDMVICEVIDNGKGRSMASKNSKSMGIQITQNRINILNTSEWKKGGLQLYDLDQGLRVEVILPLEYEL